MEVVSGCQPSSAMEVITMATVFGPFWGKPFEYERYHELCGSVARIVCGYDRALFQGAIGVVTHDPASEMIRQTNDTVSTETRTLEASTPEVPWRTPLADHYLCTPSVG